MKQDQYNKSATKVMGWIAILTLLLLSGCGGEKLERHWDGQWQRTITVPKGVQGRCVDEQLLIDKKTWRLKATLYPTFQCSQAYLELVYQGTLEQVAVKNDSDARQLELLISDIHLVEMVDILGEERTALKGSALKTLDADYVPEQYRVFRQKAVLGKDYHTLRSDLYWPLIQLAISEYPNKNAQITYKRLQ